MERGLQVKSDIGVRKAEDAEFPNVCERMFRLFGIFVFGFLICLDLLIACNRLLW